MGVFVSDVASGVKMSIQFGIGQFTLLGCLQENGVTYVRKSQRTA